MKKSRQLKTASFRSSFFLPFSFRDGGGDKDRPTTLHHKRVKKLPGTRYQHFLLSGAYFYSSPPPQMKSTNLKNFKIAFPLVLDHPIKNFRLMETWKKFRAVSWFESTLSHFRGWSWDETLLHFTNISYVQCIFGISMPSNMIWSHLAPPPPVDLGKNLTENDSNFIFLRNNCIWKMCINKDQQNSSPIFFDEERASFSS